MNILITGSKGQLGAEITELSKNSQHNFHLKDRHALDITDQDALNDFFSTNKLDYCVNCAAYTQVDKAESDETMAFRINHEAVANLSILCKQHKVRLIHISSDYVYHNELRRPLLENDPTNAQGIYARSKLMGDQAVLETNPEAIIIRTSWVYSSYGHNFVKTMIRLGESKDQLNIINDQIGTPTYANDLAKVIMHIIEQNDPDMKGIYHYSNEDQCSWYDFAMAIFEICNIDCKVTAIPSSAYPTPASRPSYSVLNKARIKAQLDIEIPHWRDSLERCIDQLNLSK